MYTCIQIYNHIKIRKSIISWRSEQLISINEKYTYIRHCSLGLKDPLITHKKQRRKKREKQDKAKKKCIESLTGSNARDKSSHEFEFSIPEQTILLFFYLSQCLLPLTFQGRYCATSFTFILRSINFWSWGWSSLLSCFFLIAEPFNSDTSVAYIYHNPSSLREVVSKVERIMMFQLHHFPIDQLNQNLFILGHFGRTIFQSVTLLDHKLIETAFAYGIIWVGSFIKEWA